MNWVKFKAQAQLNKKCSAVKHTKIKGVPKLDDANDAGNKVWCAVKILKRFQPGCSFQDCWFISGGKNSTSCTLILTEGDSAKTLAVSGLGVVGRDRYGVFPLRGKMLNVREASHKQVCKFKNIVLTASWGCINYRPHNSIIIIIYFFADHGECWDQQRHKDPGSAVQEELQWPWVTQEPALRQAHDHDRSGQTAHRVPVTEYSV